MARDYKKLRTFHLADDLALAVYKATQKFPREELFGLTSQMRRAALSVPANIVEGSQRSGEAEYINFLNIALGSCGEVNYFISFAQRLNFITSQESQQLTDRCETCLKSLQSLVTALKRLQATGNRLQTKTRSP